MSNRLRPPSAWLTPRRVTLIDAASLTIASLAVILRFLEFHALLAPIRAPSRDVLRAMLPHSPPTGFGWWSWWDQSWYLEAALAWAHLDLDPARHWYPPGYPLLGALFARLTPADPFMLPDLACMLAALWLFAAVAGELWGRAALGRSIGAALFVATSVASKLVASAWVVPWTTTPETVLLLACLLGTIRFVARPRPSDAALAGFAAATTLAFRPADAAIVGGVCAAAILTALLSRWPGWPRAGRIVGAAFLAAAIPLAVFGTAYLAVNGLHLDGYLQTSAAYGFEWRLLPLRWVLLVIDPQPLFVDGSGLAQTFTWLVPGFVGMAACLLFPPGPASRWRHGVIVAAVLADTLVFLCYRDLHPDFLWQNGVYHYFKWTLPVFALYAALLLRAALLGPRLAPRLAAATACALLPLLFTWRVQVTGATELGHPADAQTLALPHGLSSLQTVLFARTAPGQTALVPFDTTIDTATQHFRSTFDFKLTPWPQTVMVQPLRPMPDAPATLTFPAYAYTLDPGSPAILGRASLVWDLPCWIRPERRLCRPRFLLPATSLAPGQPARFGAGASGEVYRLSGLGQPEAKGDWTVSPRASLAFRVPPGTPPRTLTITANGFAPLGQPVRVTAYANGTLIGHWSFGSGTTTAASPLPLSAIGPHGDVLLDLVIANPDVPSHYAATSDNRVLGIMLHQLEVTP